MPNYTSITRNSYPDRTNTLYELKKLLLDEVDRLGADAIAMGLTPDWSAVSIQLDFDLVDVTSLDRTRRETHVAGRSLEISVRGTQEDK